jgi:hypothetical protein
LERRPRASMTRNSIKSIVVLLLTACATPQRPAAGPIPAPVSTEPTIEPADHGPWRFQYQSDTVSYQISRSAAIESEADSGAQREIATNNSHEILTLSVNTDTVRYLAVLDSFSTATQGRIGSVQQVSLPVQLSGLIDSANSLSAADSATSPQSCDPAQSSLQSDTRNLLIRFPPELAAGQTWRDSSATSSCYGTIPMKASIVRKYSVLGRTSYNGQSLVTIERTDSISAHGNGRQQQHRLVVDASGTGKATYYLSPERSVIIHLTTDQQLEFAIQASGKTNRFRESAKQEYSLVP